MLLQAGANPNLKVFTDEFDHGSQLRPVLVEYIASNECPNLAVISMLIRHGARVSLTKINLTKHPKTL